MKRYLIYIYTLLTVSSIITSCDVHEWPRKAELVPVYITLTHDTAWSKVIVPFSRSIIEDSDYDIRYSIRAYPLDKEGNVSQTATSEFLFTRPLSNTLDDSFHLDIPEGQYHLLVWTDYVKRNTLTDYFHNTTRFEEMSLYGDHKANTDFRDGFRGKLDLTLESGIHVLVADTFNIPMERPMGKYEFICTDVRDFIDKEVRRLKQEAATRGESYEHINQDDIPLDNYYVVIQYAGFMPNTYNVFTDKAIDSSTGIQFLSKLTPINEEEASMGFDYVLINEEGSSVIVNLGLYNKEGVQLSMTTNISVPIKRDQHTLLKGKFLMMNSDGGVSIDPEFDGEYNIIIP